MIGKCKECGAEFKKTKIGQQLCLKCLRKVKIND